MIILSLKVQNVNTVLQSFDNIRIYRDVAQNAPFTDPPITTIPLVANQTDYEYNDTTGDNTSWYEASYFSSANNTESNKTPPFPGTPATGPLGILTPDYVRANTDFQQIANLSDSRLGTLIFRAEALLQRYADRLGGWSTGVANFAQTQITAARLMLEEIYMRSLPANRLAEVTGITSERIGTYSYSKRATQQAGSSLDLKSYFSAELWDMLRILTATSPTKVSMTTTEVFPQLDPYVQYSTGFEIVPYWDGIDEELMYDGIPYRNWSPRVRSVIIYPQN